MDIALLEQLHGDVEHRQRLQAEEVELDQSRRLDPLHVELGHRHIRFRIAIERHQFAERPVADDDAGGMGRGVAGKPFETLRDVEGARHHRILIAKRLQFRLALNRGGERHRRGRILRHQFGQLVDLSVGHLQDAPDVAQHAARLQRSEGDDLRHLIAAVALLHVIDHLAASVLAEVDVEVRHRHAFRIEEALEQQAKADWIEVGDGQRIGDQRSRAGAAARPDRNSLRLGPFDEIRNDQEVTRIVHAGDDVDLEGEPRAIVFFGRARREAMDPEPVAKPLLGLAAHFRRFLALRIGGVAPAPTVNRGRIGLRVLGRNAQRSAISTVEASASGRSANSTAISARVLKR